MGVTGQRLVADIYSTEVFRRNVVELYDEVFER